jgi:cell division transport system permease protein
MLFRNPFRRRERTIGTARRKRRYDLPLNKGTGSGFLILLVALMTFLAMMAIGASFTLAVLQDRWSSGLENRATVEIPAQDAQGQIIPAEQIQADATQIADMLRAYPGVAAVHVMGDDEIHELVRPWLGDDLLLADMPLPALISITMDDRTPANANILQDKIRAIAPQARLDTHQGWLNDVLRFTGALKFAAALLVATIGVTTVTAVAGAVRARMAVYRAEVELLHLMGATDNYISRQFQRYAMILALQGGVAGTVAGALAMLAIGWGSGRMDVNLLPGFSLTWGQIGILALLPVMAGAISMMTARRTVMRVLGTMP